MPAYVLTHLLDHLYIILDTGSLSAHTLQVTSEPIKGLLHIQGPGMTLAADLVEGAEPPPGADGASSTPAEEEPEVCAVLCANSMIVVQVCRHSGYEQLCVGLTESIVALQCMPHKVSSRLFLVTPQDSFMACISAQVHITCEWSVDQIRSFMWVSNLLRQVVV